MFLVVILFICFIVIMLVLTLFKNFKLFAKIMPNDVDEFSGSSNRIDEVEPSKVLEIELQNNLRLLEYLMTMEHNVNVGTFKTLEEVKRFREYKNLKTDVEKRILKIVDNKEPLTGS